MGKHHPDADQYIGRALEDVLDVEEARHGKDDLWYCQTCGHGPNANAADGACPQCGRDVLGRQTGIVMPKLDREPRPQTRDDVPG